MHVQPGYAGRKILEGSEMDYEGNPGGSQSTPEKVVSVSEMSTQVPPRPNQASTDPRLKKNLFKLTNKGTPTERPGSGY